MVLCGCRFQDSSVFAMCGALRVFEYARMSRACAGMLRFAFWSVVEAGGVCSLKTRYRARRCSGFWLTCNLKFGTSLRGSRKGKRCPRDKKRCIHFDDPFTTQESSNFATLLEHNRSLVDIALKGEFTPRPVFTRYRGLFVLGASFRVCNLHRASLGFFFFRHAKICSRNRRYASFTEHHWVYLGKTFEGDMEVMLFLTRDRAHRLSLLQNLQPSWSIIVFFLISATSGCVLAKKKGRARSHPSSVMEGVRRCDRVRPRRFL